MDQLNPSDLFSSLDNRYFSEIKSLVPYLTEFEFYKRRVQIEVTYLLVLVNFLKVVDVSKEETDKLTAWADSFDNQSLAKVKDFYESRTNHDVKAIEYFIRDELKGMQLTKLSPWIHWGLTSEDVNNLAYAVLFQKAKDEVLTAMLDEVLKVLDKWGTKYADVIMPARTHGQVAVPTTIGKEFRVFHVRLLFFYDKVKELKLGGKLNGAVGNFNAFYQLYPKHDWLKFSQTFVEQLGLKYTAHTTQIEPMVEMVYFFDLLRQVNNVCLDLAKDCWLYISYGYFTQRQVQDEVGSSTMPHKVNPINFENAEGNLEIANSLLQYFSNKLPQSRLQRDLSDSVVKRKMGEALCHSFLAWKKLVSGLNKIEPHTEFLKSEVKNHPEMLSEALQLYLKTHGMDRAYDKIKLKTRGQSVSWDKMIQDLPQEMQSELKTWKVETYTGIASQLAKTRT